MKSPMITPKIMVKDVLYVCDCDAPIGHDEVEDVDANKVTIGECLLFDGCECIDGHR